MKLSKYVSLAEFEASQTAVRFGLSNTMNAVETAAAKLLCNEVLDRIREHYKAPLIISSGFRSVAVNAKVGGVSTSQHCKGEAADFTIVGVSVEQVFADIKAGKIKGLVYDQLIQEFGGWIHISFKVTGNRKQNLRAIHQKGKAVYLAA